MQEGVGKYQFLKKSATHFPHINLLTPPFKWRFLYDPPTPFCYNPRPWPPTLLLINNIYSWKTKLKHTGVDIECFFVNIKSSLTKHKKYLLEAPYRTSETSLPTKIDMWFGTKWNFLLGKKWHLFFQQNFFTVGLVVIVLKAETERTFVIDIQDLLITLSIYRSDMFYIFLDMKKKETCWMHFKVNF